jgi:hypothetical protein
VNYRTFFGNLLHKKEVPDKVYKPPSEILRAGK